MGNFIVSALKYRPQTFKDVVGQSAITTTLGLEMGSATRSGGEKTAQSTAEEGVPPEDVPRAQGPAAASTMHTTGANVTTNNVW